MSSPSRLRTRSVDSVDELAMPDGSVDVTVDSPALTVFTDFRKHQPVVIDSETSIPDAEVYMAKAHVRLNLVVDKSMHFLGTLGFRDLYGEESQKRMAHGTSRTDISVRDVMVPREKLQAIEYDNLTRASVADVIETLKQEHSQHFLIVDSEAHEIRGIVSAGDLARRLHIPIDISKAPSFEEICHALAKQA